MSKIKVLVDLSNAMHADIKSHMGEAMKWRVGALLHKFTKEKLNDLISTWAEIMCMNNYLPNTVWARMLPEGQGYSMQDNILFQISHSANKIKLNERRSYRQKSQQSNVWYSFIKDRLESKHIWVVFCIMSCMLVDFFIKTSSRSILKKHEILIEYVPLKALLEDIPNTKQKTASLF